MSKFIGTRLTLPNLATAPSSPAAGDAYYDTVANTVYVYNGTSWVDLAAAGGGDITAVVAGTGLSGGASSGSATLDVDTTTIATRAYAESLTTGMNWHGAVTAATDAVLPNSPTYTAGTADQSSGYGIGAYIEAGSNADLIIDGLSPSVGNRVLVKNQANAVHNGIYSVTSAGSPSTKWKLTRATDSNNNIAGQVSGGDAVFVLPGGGINNSGQGFVLTSIGSQANAVHAVGTDNQNWTQFTGLAGVVAGNGISISGDTFSVKNGSGLVFGAGSPAFLDVDFDNSVSGTSTVKAATAAVAKQINDAAAAAQSTANAAIPKSALSAKGAIVTASAAETPSTLAVGTNNQVLIASSTEVGGLDWIDAPWALATDPTIFGKITIDNATGAPIALGAISDDVVLHAVNEDGAASIIVLDAHGTNKYGRYVSRTSGGTSASPSATQSGQTLGEFAVFGRGATGYLSTESVILRGVATENFTNTAGGGKVEVVLIGAGTTSQTTAATIATGYLDIASGASFKINGTSVLSSTTLGSGVTVSSLTSVGTIGTGTWQGTAVGVLYGGTGSTTAQGARTAILPSQASQTGKVLQTDGSDVVWYSLDTITVDGGSA
jgi:hypothetical protein